MCSTAVRRGVTVSGGMGAWSAKASRPHAAASAVSGRRRVLICWRDVQSASILTTTSRSFWCGVWRTVLLPTLTCSRRGAKQSRWRKKYPKAAHGAYCVLCCIADRLSRFVMMAYLRLGVLKPQVVCHFGAKFDSFDPLDFCAKFRREAFGLEDGRD